jgi:hypothetical protein
MSKYPVLKATMEELKKNLSIDFKLVYGYSGSNDSGWFDGFHFQGDKGYSNTEPLIVSEALLDYVNKYNEEIEKELYTLLESRFPGWEIGDGDVNGANGSFIIKSSNMTIAQEHNIEYNSFEDASPEEVEEL